MGSRPFVFFHECSDLIRSGNLHEQIPSLMQSKCFILKIVMHHKSPHFLFSQYFEIYEMQMISLPKPFPNKRSRNKVEASE